ncbi:MAG: DNA polymerase IV [Aquihabitans sp.]
MEPSILHIDMDAFFASVELRRHPELRGQPVVVGGAGPRGVVAAASYEARAFGIHSAMPGVRARRLCPHAVFLPGDHAHYSEVSARIMQVFRDATPFVEPLSLDEAFLDVSSVRRLSGPAAQIAAEIRQRIWETEQLTCSVGVARLKFLAKLATEAAKPRASRVGTRPGTGVMVVDPDRELEFLHPLPVKALWGVGPVTLGKLERLGVHTVGDLAVLSESALAASLGAAAGRHLHNLANARDPRSVEPAQVVKSVSHEETFPRDQFDRDDLERDLLRLADAVATRLRHAQQRGRTITVKVRFGDFSTITRSVTLPQPTDSARELTRVARRLFGDVDPSPGVRLIGVGVSHLGDETGGEQLSFDSLEAEPEADWTRAEAVVDEIRARFGARSVGPASLTGPDGLRVARRGDQQWGPTRPD